MPLSLVDEAGVFTHYVNKPLGPYPSPAVQSNARYQAADFGSRPTSVVVG